MNKRLHSELRGTGASESEARELTALAGRLGDLKNASPSPTHVFGRRLWVRFVPASLAGAVFLLLGMSSVTFAQSSMPGNWLYPVKRLSEDVTVKANPNYRATLMMRRADEVRALIANHANPLLVNDTITAYKAQAAAYTNKHNYAAFEYCETSLKLAAANATPGEKSMIDNSLEKLHDKD